MSDESVDEFIEAATEGMELGEDEFEIDLNVEDDFAPFTANVPVEVIAAEVKQGPKARYIACRLRVIEGEHAGRVVFDNINITGGGASIGARSLIALGAAEKGGNKVSIKNLIGAKGIAHCAPEGGDGPYADKVRVKRYSPYKGQAAAEADHLK